MLSSMEDRLEPAHGGDAVLLAETLVAASFAYGDDQARRGDVVRAFLWTLPEVRGRDVPALFDRAVGSVRRLGAVAAIRRLRALGDEAVRRRCLILAIDVAFSCGILDEGETLELLRETLAIPAKEASAYADVLGLKYAADARHAP